jgi:hypothetical protein
MARTYDAQSMVDLPVMDAHSTVTVTTSMLAAGKKEKKLAAGVVKARDRLQARRDDMADGLRDELGEAKSKIDPRDVEKQEIAGWVATESWLKGLKDMPTQSQKAKMADELHGVLFAGGVKFIRGTSAKRWSETEKRLALIEKRQFDAIFHTLGGAEVLVTLKERHKSTGEALGITTPKAVVETPQIREKLDALKGALRFYILQVVATVDPEEAETAAAAERLLSAITTYEPAARKPNVPEAPIVFEPLTAVGDDPAGSANP